MDILTRERAKYLETWANPAYRDNSPGLRQLSSALEWMHPAAGASITDWGAGDGQASEAMARLGYQVRLVDIASNAYVGTLPYVEACLWDLPDSLAETDHGYCTDVMEHVPTEHIDQVLAGIAVRTLVSVYFQIALFHASHTSSHGPLHLSVLPADDWRERLGRAFSRVEIQATRRYVRALAHV